MSKYSNNRILIPSSLNLIKDQRSEEWQLPEPDFDGNKRDLNHQMRAELTGHPVKTVYLNMETWHFTLTRPPRLGAFV